MPDDVALEWQPIWSSVCDLHSFWKFHSDLCGNPQHVALLQDILPGPLLFIRRALLQSITLEIGRLLDRAAFRERPNLSIERLLETVRSHCPADPVNTRLARMLASARAHCEPLTTWRHRRFAHADREMVLCAGDEQFPDVDREAFEKAFALLRELLQEVYAHFNGPDAAMPFPERAGDADALMDYIRAGHEARQAEVAAMFPQ
jgi:hypothetical protein